jgi:putative acetyltransferase
MDFIIRRETVADRYAVYRVHQLAFGQEMEGRLVNDLHDGGFSRVSLVAESGDRVVGHVLFSELLIQNDSGSLRALSLAPVAVLPEFQRRGIGQSLITLGIQECRKQGHGIALVLGDPQFYRRFGFSTESASQLESPYAGPFFMGLEIVPGTLQGVVGRVSYPPPFDAFT